MNTLTNLIEQEQNYTLTENGALTHISTLSHMADLFGMGGALRSRDEQSVITLFSKAFSEDKLLATKCLFYLRDCRQGQGERKTFRIILKWLANNYPYVVIKNFDLITEYGRYDDFFVLEDTVVWEYVINLITREFGKFCENGKPSLLFKWLPSINTSSKESRRLARKICKSINFTEKGYRKNLSKARAQLKIVEKDMCANKWGEIEYSRVPSKAALNYRNAFNRHDTVRYQQFIKDVALGKAKINASTTYPYEIVEKILYKPDTCEVATLDAIWNSLPNYVNNNPHKGIVVADVSGSMSGRPMAVSISLAIYFAERNSGPFKNKFFTFSDDPRLETVIGNNIVEKVNNLQHADWGMSTNLQSVFDTILKIAKENNLPQSEMPDALYIVSDMEFNVAISGHDRTNAFGITNFYAIDQKYEEAGYKRPNLIFWNVNAKNNNVPITKNDKGVCLVSGCSPVILTSLLSGKEISIIDVMLETLNKHRYSKITV